MKNAFKGTPRHNVFVSYHHSNGDQWYRDAFEKFFAETHEVIISKSVQIGDLDPTLSTETIREKIRDEYLRESTVTVVLIGPETCGLGNRFKHQEDAIQQPIRFARYHLTYIPTQRSIQV
jgi:hypothetical protein